jgi:hypothetical protein
LVDFQPKRYKKYSIFATFLIQNSGYKELSSGEENTGEENIHREKVRRERPGKTGMNDTCRSTTDPDTRVSQKTWKSVSVELPGADKRWIRTHMLSAVRWQIMPTSAIPGPPPLLWGRR